MASSFPGGVSDEMTNKLPKFEGMTEDDEAVLRGAIARMNAHDVKQFNEYELRIADLEAQLAEAQRREGLLRVVAVEATDIKWSELLFADHFISYMVSKLDRQMLDKALQAAINGGAMEEA